MPGEVKPNKYRVQTATGILLVESPTRFESREALQQAINSGMPGLKVTAEGADVTVSQGFLQRFKRGLVQDTTKGIKENLLKAGIPEEVATRRAESIGGLLQAGVPGSPADLGRVLLPLLINRLVPAGRTAARIGGQLFGNVAGSSVLEAGQEALAGRSALGGALKGAAQGVPGGLAQATIGGVLGPNRATLKAQQASATARLSDMFSPTVRTVIPEDPKAILSGQTVRSLTEAARRDLDVMEQTIRDALAPVAGIGKKGLQAKFDFMRERVKSLQDIGDQPRTKPELAGKARQAMAEAATLNQQIVQLLQSNQRGDLATLYSKALATHAKDRAQIRVLKAIQRAQSLPGGVNRADNPETAEFVDALKSPQLSQEARTAFAAFLFAMRHPLIAIGQLAHPGKGGFIDPQKVKPPLGRGAAGPLGVLGGAAASLTAKDQPPEGP